MHAIHLVDLMVLQRDDPVMRIFLTPKVGGPAIDVKGSHFDSFAVALICPDEQAGAIVELLRTKYRKAEVRCYYRGQRGGWKRV